MESRLSGLGLPDARMNIGFRIDERNPSTATHRFVRASLVHFCPIRLATVHAHTAVAYSPYGVPKTTPVDFLAIHFNAYAPIVVELPIHRNLLFFPPSQPPNKRTDV